MQLKTAKAIVKAAEEMDLTVTLREGYSGRGMYGKTTTGVVGSHSDVMKAIAAAAMDCKKEDQEEFLEDMDLATDSMGRSMIFY